MRRHPRRLGRITVWFNAVRDRRHGLPAPAATGLSAMEQRIQGAVNLAVRSLQARYFKAAERLKARLAAAVDALGRHDRPELDRLRLVIFSDMLEDSGVARFDRGLDRRRAERIIADRRTAPACSALTGTEVYVIGAAAPSPALMREVERFWAAYFAAVGAVLKPEQYGPVLFGL